MMEDSDARHLERALSLAHNAGGRTSPNPLVGAVVVKHGRLVGEGWHAGPGCDHAEIAAIKDALARRGGRRLRGGCSLDHSATRLVCAGATMYVTLEPCCTVGRTPPCTGAIVAGGFARVIVGAIDPSPAVNGKGIQLLRAAGIKVEVAEGTLAHRARRQNDGLRKSVTLGVPFVTYKYAMSVDGRVATDSGESRWISSAESRELVHRWRAWSDAVVIGAGTLAHDDPQLTARDVWCARQPLRVVVGRRPCLSPQTALARSITEGPVLAVVGEECDPDERNTIESRGMDTVVVRHDASGHLDPLEVCRTLATRGVQTVLLEGGPRIAGAWWNAGLIDRIAAFVCPKVISGERHGAPLLGPGSGDVPGATALREVEMMQVGPDVLMAGYREGPF